MITLLSVAALASCSTEALEEPSIPVAGERVVVSATIGASDGRVAMEEIEDPAGNYVKVNWRNDDSPEEFAVKTGSGSQSIVHFAQTESTEDSPSLFEGPSLRPGSYKAIYPPEFFAYGNTEIVGNLSRQTGELTESLCMMYDSNSNGKSFHFKHQTAIINPTFKVGNRPLATNTITSVKLISETIPNKCDYLQWGTVNVNVDCDALEEIYIYIMAKVGVEDVDRSFDVYVTTTDSHSYHGTLTVPEGKRLEPGKFYTPTIALTAPVEQFDMATTEPTPDEEIVGDGSAEEPYKIATAGDLAWMLGKVQMGMRSNTHFQLESNFAIESDAEHPWTLGSIVSPFTGVLDGKGHTITGTLVANPSAITAGFVGANQGEIKNLHIDATVVGSAAVFDLMGVGIPIGGVGAVAGLNQGIVDGCTSSGTVCSELMQENGLVAVGGLVGVNLGVISNSTNTAAVQAAPYDGSLLVAISTAGGIAGGIAGGAIVGCTNNGTVEGATSSNMDEDPDEGLSLTAGIVGLCMPAADVQISGCSNTVAITGAGTRNYDALANDTYTAGIVAFIKNTDMGASVTISECQNSAPITGGVSAYCGDSFVGGIVGVNNMANISNCVNTAAATITAGDAMATETSEHNYEPGYTYAGGIVANHRGHMDDNQTWIVTALLSDCQNYAAVNGPLEGVRCYLGGIAGCNEGGHAVIERCKNYGALTGRGSEKTDNLYLAGIVGVSNGSAATIAYCENHGTVTGGISGYDNHTAGIAAYSTGQCSEPGYEGWIARIYGCVNKSTATITPGTYLGYGNPDYLAQLWATGGLVAYNWSLVCNCCVDETNYGDGQLIGYGTPVVSGEHDEQNHINTPEA